MAKDALENSCRAYWLLCFSHHISFENTWLDSRDQSSWHDVTPKCRACQASFLEIWLLAPVTLRGTLHLPAAGLAYLTFWLSAHFPPRIPYLEHVGAWIDER